MPEPAADDERAALRAENARLHTIIRALMDRAERATEIQGNEFSLFETAVMLDEQVRSRTAELEAAVHENERINRVLRESESRYRAMFDQSLVGIALIDKGRFTYSNPRFDEIFGYSADEVRGLGPHDLALPEEHARMQTQFERRLSGTSPRVHYQLRCRHRDGRTLDVEIHGSLMEMAGRRVLVSFVQDVSERCRAEREVLVLQERLRELSLRDPLTGLHNRRHLDAALPLALQAARARQQPVSVLMVDLDHFKRVNDQHGHPAGDEVLRRVAELLRRSARSSDITGRCGGEEFLLVLPGLDKPAALQRADQLRRAIEALCIEIDLPHESGNSRLTLRLSATIGVATCPPDGDDADALVAAADLALYAAKAAGRNRVGAA
jgi:diguanylate cyclase (GGDEF)-like protein/PAS domain S-box-containing protein